MKTQEFHPAATAGLYAEVIKQIYDSLDKRIREAVSNALDVHAKRVTISIFQKGESKIVIADDGVGMDAYDLQEKYIKVGGGDNYNNPETIGRIGIGALSVFGIGDKIRIVTRKKGGKQILTAALDFTRIKKASEHATPLEEITLGEITHTREAKDGDAAHFTEIVITELTHQVKEIFNSSTKTKNLIEKLERILPVLYRKDDELYNQIASETAAKFKNERYEIKAILHIPHLDYNEYEIFRRSIFSVQGTNIGQIYSISPYKIPGGFHSDLSVHGYLYVNAGKQLPRVWQGINVRVKNVTIERNSYFGHEFEKDAAARVRIGGELFIENIDENNAIQTNRSGFTRENNDYIRIAEYMRERIKDAIAIVRRQSDIDSIVKKVVKQLQRLRAVFVNTAAVMGERADAGGIKSLDDDTIVLPSEVPVFSLEDHLKTELAGTSGFDFIWGGVLEDHYYIKYEEDDYCTVFVHKNLKEFIFDIAGMSVEFVLGYCGEERPLMIKKPGKVYLNLDNTLVPDKDITCVDIGFIEAVLVLYLNKLCCDNDAEVLYRITIDDLSKMHNL